ncbi:retrotransposon protein, putative, ty1-copia subclass [Tanacetum coccineum]
MDSDGNGSRPVVSAEQDDSGDRSAGGGGVCRFRGIILLILGGFAWYYTHAYIEDGVTFIAKSSLTFLAKSKSHIVLGIAPVAIIDRQLPFEYTITSRSTDVVVVDVEREKLSGNNFNDRFRQLKLVLRVEKKMYVIEQPLPAAPAANSEANVLLEWNAIYDAYNEGKDKQVYISKPKNPKPSAKEHPAKDDACHHYKEVGHWKRNCPVYLAELLKKKKQVGSVSSLGIFTIELFAFPNKSSVYDTGCGTNICITKQGFKEARKLKQGALYLYVGNGVRAQVEAIRSYDLVLPNVLVICLDNCHYAPSILRGVVSVHRLVENGFVQHFTDFGISVSGNNVYSFNAIPSNGIYEIDMHDLVPNVNSIYNVSTKRTKHNLDSTYLWHCRLAHISKKCIEKLQQEGLLKSTDDESFDQYVSCLSGKMIRKSFPHHPERATDLLGIIHTDVCGPLRHVSRQGASYFITFTDDYSRYGYVYLLKHKHEEKSYFVRHGSIYDESYYSAVILLGLCSRVCNTHSQYGSNQEDLEEIQDEDTSPSEITSEIPMEVEGFEPPQEEVIPVRRSERTHRAPDRLCLNVEAEEHSLGDLNEPLAINAEIQSMMDNMVWVLVNLPPGCKTVGIDYEEMFSPVVDIRAIRILISIAAFYDYEIWQMDVKTAFLNGYLDEDIYMVQPEGFVDPNHPRKVCKLQRSIYGLKQASRSWNKRFDEEIKRFGFAQNLDEPCVYQKASGSNVTFLILYVDDIIIMGNHIPSLQSVKDYLGKCFAMKDLGEASFILGIKIYRDRSKRLIGLGQNAYMDKILKRYKMDNSKHGHILMQERLDLNKT